MLMTKKAKAFVLERRSEHEMLVRFATNDLVVSTKTNLFVQFLGGFWR